jgi:hypothetical protein
VVSERAIFAGIGCLADSNGRAISRFLKRGITVSRYEQLAQGVVERLAFDKVLSVGYKVSAGFKVSAVTGVNEKFTRFSRTGSCSRRKSAQTTDVTKISE